MRGHEQVPDRAWAPFAKRAPRVLHPLVLRDDVAHTAEGDVVEREPRLRQRPAGDYRQRLPPALQKLAPRGFDPLDEDMINWMERQ